MSESAIEQKKRITDTADLLRRGATLLREPCPKCGGLQVRYGDRVLCINCDDLDSPQSGRPQRKEQEIVQPLVASDGPNRAPEQARPSDEDSALRNLLHEKLAIVRKELEAAQDVDQQSKLLDLVSKYLETLQKLDSQKS